MFTSARMLDEPQCYRCVFCIPIAPGDVRVKCANQTATAEAHEIARTDETFDWPRAFDPIYILKCDGFTDSEFTG